MFCLSRRSLHRLRGLPSKLSPVNVVPCRISLVLSFVVATSHVELSVASLNGFKSIFAMIADRSTLTKTDKIEVGIFE